MKRYWPIRWTTLSLLALMCGMLLSGLSDARERDWQRRKVDWHVGRGQRIKAIHYPRDREPVRRSSVRRKLGHEASRRPKAEERSAADSGAVTTSRARVSVQTLDVNSPPVEGFVPWVAVSITKERSADLDFEAVPERSLVGRYPVGVTPSEDYAIGIFDTGAGVHLMGYEAAQRAGLYSNGMVTGNEVTIGGATSTVDTSVSYPLGLFVDGLGAIDPETLKLDTSSMKGQSNVALAVGQRPVGRPDLPTAIGAPLSAYYTTVIYNDRPLTIMRDGNEYSTPDIILYDHGDPDTPSFPYAIPLELRPLGGISVQYIPTVDFGLGGLGGDLDSILGGFGGGGSDFPPSIPSVIIGNSSQSLFFVHSVDLRDEGSTALDRTRFMIDTGAQVTVVGSRIAARLRLNASEAEFEVEIEDVTGTVTMYPGFHLDSLDIPALGDWLHATHVPVVLIDIGSPEGGTLDGIIGMNLFNDFNLILRGGGLVPGEDPSLEFEPIDWDSVVSSQ